LLEELKGNYFSRITKFNKNDISGYPMDGGKYWNQTIFILEKFKVSFAS